MDKITGEQAIKALRVAVANRGPQYRQVACLYTDRNGNHCIAGQALVNLGVEVPDYTHYNNAIRVYSAFVGRLTQEAADILLAAQKQADLRETWGFALEFAEAEYAVEIIAKANQNIKAS